MALGGEIPEVGESTSGDGDSTAKFVNKFISRNKSAVRAWQKEAVVAEKVAMGQLWDEADAAKLREENRPTPQINFAKKYLDVTSGIEMLNRLEIQFLARVVDNNQAQRLSEEVSGIYATIMDNSRGYYENSRVFRNQLTVGMGWCLSADTMVDCPPVDAVYHRLYSGELVEIQMENGKRLTGTPNHPVLTDAGWKPMGMIEEGDHLVSGELLKGIAGLPREYFDQVETRLEDKVTSFRADGLVAILPSSSHKFHGDGIGSKVYIVGANRSLLPKALVETATVQHLRQLALRSIDRPLQFGESELSANRLRHSPIRTKMLDAFLATQFCEEQLMSFALRPSLNAAPHEKLLNSAASNSQLISNSLLRKSFAKIEALNFTEPSRLFSIDAPQCMPSADEAVPDRMPAQTSALLDFGARQQLREIKSGEFFDRNTRRMPTTILVSKVNRSHVVNHPVFNLTTDCGMYVAEGIVTSNCGERMDLTREASGEAVVDWINYMEMVWDTNSQKDNVEDGRMLVRMRVTPKERAIEEWPDKKDEIEKWAHTGELSPLDDAEYDRHVVPLKYDPLNALDKQSSIPKDFVTIKEAYWYEIETWHEFIDPFTHKARELPTDKFNEVKKAFEELYPDTKMISYKSRRRVYKRAFVIGGCTLEEGDSPMEDHFPYQCCTGDWDADQKVWRGLLWTLMEPEKYATKMFSVGLHIMATSQKGGLFFEPDVFVNQKQAEEEWARPDPFIPITEGAIANQKFLVRDPQQAPDGIFRIWSSCVDMIQQVTGINVDMLGSSTGEVPVGTTKRRQMQGVAAVAGYFNSYRRFLLNQAEALFEYIAKFYTDDRAIRIGGPYDGQVIQLAKDDVECHYDLKIDLNPMNPDQKAAAWEAMEPILPVLVKTGGIFAVPSIMDYAPLPAKLSMEIKAYLQGMAKAQQQGQGQDQEKSKGKQMPPELVKANVDLKAQQARLTASKAAAIDQESAIEKARSQMEAFTSMGEHRRAERSHRMDILGAQQDIAHKNQAQKLAQLESYTKALGNVSGAMPEAQV